jgi:glycosyltransferase involved in cell wall biosynthesis
MPEPRKSVLFLTPGASSVGGNIFLLNFLRWFKERSDIPFMIVYGHGGDLEREFEALAPSFNYGYEWNGLSGIAKNIQRIRRALGLNQRKVISEIRKKNIGLVYSNAVINHDVLNGIAAHVDSPVVAHCHELETLIQKHGIDNFDRLKARCDHFVAVADAVRENLIARHAIPDEKIEVIKEFIPVPQNRDELNARGRELRTRIGAGDDTFLVGGSGTVYWRKAPDLFIQIAARAKSISSGRDVKFVWIGGARTGDPSLIEARYDIEKLGLSDTVTFIEHMADPLAHFAAIDAFALTSREDPFPLVCLEAASLAKPIICFADAGGMPEFVRDDAGFVAPYLNLDAFAKAIVELAGDPARTELFGNRAAQRVNTDHNIETAAPRMLSVIERSLA